MNPLSPAERRALNYVAAGWRSPAIASAMGISEYAVVSHIKNANRKLAAKNRTHAVAVAIRGGLL